jgi:hypothetical protein
MGAQVIYDASQLHPGELTGIRIAETQLCGTVNWYASTTGGKNVPRYKIDLYINNDRTLRVFIKDEDLNIIDLTGTTLVMSVRKNEGDTPIFTKSTAVSAEGAIGSADEGECFFYILPSDTALLEGKYVFDVTLTTVDSKTYTVLEGILNLMQPGS